MSKVLKLFEKRNAVFVYLENRLTIEDVAGNKVESAWQVFIRPFPGHPVRTEERRKAFSRLQKY